MQNAEQKIAHHNVNQIHGAPRGKTRRQTAQKFSTFEKVFIQSAKSIGKLYKIKISFLVILFIDLTVCTKNESSFYTNRTKTALSIGKITNLF